jgi:hypothetical protein
MRKYTLPLMLLVCACSVQTDFEGTPVTVTLTAPIEVTGTWSVIDTWHVLSCAYDLTANVTGGQDDKEIEWTDATITLVAPPALNATQPYSATRVSQWFGAPTITTGSTRSAHLSVGRERPFVAEHELSYQASDGARSTTKVFVKCRAPSE